MYILPETNENDSPYAGRETYSPYAGRETLSDLSKATNYNNHLKEEIQARYRIGQRVLDFGAGSGHFLNLIKAKPPVFLAVEPDAKLRDVIRSSTLAKIVARDNISPGSLDLIYSLNVLEQIEEDQSTLRVQ